MSRLEITVFKNFNTFLGTTLYKICVNNGLNVSCYWFFWNKRGEIDLQGFRKHTLYPGRL
jgi:hypothetical protein